MKIKCTLLFLVFSPLLSFSQQQLGLSAAIESALKNNFDIQIAHNNQQIATNENTIGNAGFLPRLDLSAGISKSSNDTKQEYSNNTSVSRNGASTNNTNAGALLSWTLFDGMKMFATRSRLTSQQAASEIQTKIQIENSVQEVMNGYFNVVKFQQQINLTQNNIKLYEERLRISDTRYKIGSASRLEFLQAKVDLNAQKSVLLQAQSDLQNAKFELNRLIGNPIESEFTVADSMNVIIKPSVEDLKTSVMQSNQQVLYYLKNIDISSASINEYRSQRYPRIGFNLNYNYTKTENEVGFALLNQNQGLTGGFTLSWNLFNGFNTNRQIQNAKIVLFNSEITLKDIRSRLESELYAAFTSFNAATEIVALEEDNVIAAKENAEVALEAFKSGSISGIQLKDAQQSYEEAINRVVNARYNVKLLETQLMKLNGDLVK